MLFHGSKGLILLGLRLFSGGDLFLDGGLIHALAVASHEEGWKHDYGTIKPANISDQGEDYVDLSCILVLCVRKY